MPFVLQVTKAFREMSYKLQFDIKFITKDPELAEIHDDLSEMMMIQKSQCRAMGCSYLLNWKAPV